MLFILSLEYLQYPKYLKLFVNPEKIGILTSDTDCVYETPVNDVMSMLPKTCYQDIAIKKHEM